MEHNYEFTRDHDNTPHLYFVGDIQKSSNYLALYVNLLFLQKRERLLIHIDSEGGDFEGGISIYAHLQQLVETKEVTIKVIVMGKCHSAAAIIACAASTIDYQEGSTMMVHLPLLEFNTCTYRLSELEKKLLEIRRRAEWVAENILPRLLTKEQISRMLDGEDVYIGREA